MWYNTTIMVKEKILKTIEENDLISNNQHIVIGLSGGPDSLCLFCVLKDLAKEMNLKIYPVHINHKFRPVAAEEDQEYVENLCQEAKTPCRTFIVDCNKIAKEKKITSEEAGRQARYQGFATRVQELVDEGIPRENIRIAVAQNSNDQVETILFRILRGAGTDGLSGINYSRRDEYGNQIIRPMLDVTRDEVERYCDEKNLTPRIDKTNLEPIYARNKIRLELIPYLEKEYNNNIKDTINRLGKIATVDKEYIWKQVNAKFPHILLTESKDKILLDGVKLSKEEKAIRLRIISLALEKIGLDQDVTFAHMEKCDNLIFNHGPSASIDLPNGYVFRKIYDNIEVARSSGKTREISWQISEMSYDDYGSYRENIGLHGAFDADLLKEAFGNDIYDKIDFRHRKEGDYFYFAKEKTKAIQDYFVDSKIPKSMREEVDLLAINREIIWIVPLEGKSRYSARYKLCDETKSVIVVEIIGTL
ncbi:MAG: tRNA lysidine(34) synthetase TilS [Anaerovoracaceae bacterium]